MTSRDIRHGDCSHVTGAVTRLPLFIAAISALKLLHSPEPEPGEEERKTKSSPRPTPPPQPVIMPLFHNSSRFGERLSTFSRPVARRGRRSFPLPTLRNRISGESSACFFFPFLSGLFNSVYLLIRTIYRSICKQTPPHPDKYVSRVDTRNRRLMYTEMIASRRAATPPHCRRVRGGRLCRKSSICRDRSVPARSGPRDIIGRMTMLKRTSRDGRTRMRVRGMEKKLPTFPGNPKSRSYIKIERESGPIVQV